MEEGLVPWKSQKYHGNKGKGKTKARETQHKQERDNKNIKTQKQRDKYTTKKNNVNKKRNK